MRPLILTMSAFGPYPEKVVLDFTRLGTEGIYLITGDTGAGKTTIFDGIVYALYGEASGELRQSGNLRSLYAKADMPTFVELKFSYRDRVYIVKRNPTYWRKSRRGDKLVEETSKVSLRLLDSDITWSGIKEVNAKITEILSLDKAQFTQIAMLAQGNFLKLLMSSTKEKGEIFRKLFATDNYQRLQEQVKEIAARSKTALEKQLLQIEHYLQMLDLSVSVPETPNRAEILLTIEMDLMKKQHALENLSKEITAKVKQQEKNNILYGKAETQKIVRQEMEQAENYLLIYDKKRPSLKARAEALAKKYQAEYEPLVIHIRELRKEDDYCQKLVALRAEMATEVQRMKVLQESEKKLEIDLTKQLKTLAELEQLGDKLQKNLILLEQYKNNMHQLTEEKEKIELLRLEALRGSNLEKKIKEEQKKYQQQQMVVDKKRAEYNHLERSYLDAQAGILASTLLENEACPVCGSLEHPHLASLPQMVPSKEQLETLKKSKEKEENTLQSLSKKVNNFIGERKGLWVICSVR